MLAGAPAAATTSRVREHKETSSNSSNIDRQYHHQEHQHQHLTALSSNKLSQQQNQSTKSSRLLSSSISTSVEQSILPPQQQQQQQGSSIGSMNINRRNKLSQQHTRFTSHINPMSSTTTASSVSDAVASHPSAMPPPLPMQDKTDIFHLHYIDQANSSTSTNINSSLNATNTNTTSSSTTHMKSQLQGQIQAQQQQQQQQQHYQMLKSRHKDDVIAADKLDYATSSFTNVDDLTNAIRNKVIVEEDEEDILSSDNTYLY